MQMLLTRLDKQFDRLMAEEENSDGCFTRAYIKAAFSGRAAERKIWGALLSLMASKDQVGRVWNNWLSERLKRHSKTDSRIELGIVRLAADGVWLERIMNAKSKNLKGVEEYLIEMTRITLADHPPGISVSLQVEYKRFIGNGHFIGSLLR
jgi:hypothetical protein